MLTADALAAIKRKVFKIQEKNSPTSSPISSLMLGFLLTVVIFASAGLFIYYGMQVRNLKRKTKAIERVFMNIERTGTEFLPLLGNLSLPPQLQTTPLAEKSGLVLGTKKIAVRGVTAPYNPSIIEQEDGYLLVFRYDVIKGDCPYQFYTYIGCCALDANFEQTEKEFIPIDTNSQYSEDPRIVQIAQEIYLLFNDLPDQSDGSYRTIHVGKLNLKESKLDFSTNLDLQMKPVEKNWVPFEHVANGKASICIEYYLNPQKIMKLPDPEKNELIHLHSSNSSSYHKIFWPHLWGHPRGGATARLVKDQYLSFFHSSFDDSHRFPWYVMAAYTFEKDPPFRITAISHYPILFEGIYDSPHMNTAEPKKRVIFPGGFTEGVKDGKEVIYLCCGENDSGIKLITLDKQILLNTLKPL